MTKNTLRPDNVAFWNPKLFEKLDGQDDADFHSLPHKTAHMDATAVNEVTKLYRKLLPPQATILDLMSSWRSHLPTDIQYGRVVGLGLNAEEMIGNPQLSAHTIHDLNKEPKLPYGTGTFDAVCCCVSVQYLQKPVEVFQDVARVLKPGGVFVVTFSNQYCQTKAINLWRNTDDAMHMDIVTLYFQATHAWRDITYQNRSTLCSKRHHGDPLWAVWAFAEAR